MEDDGHASIAHSEYRLLIRMSKLICPCSTNRHHFYLVVADITPSQFIFINGRWKLNDFNRCRFMRVRKEDGAPCGFYVGANPGKVSWCTISALSLSLSLSLSRSHCQFFRVITNVLPSQLNVNQFRAPEEYAFAIENEMVDIYSMGNIFYSILSGIMPFEGQKESKAKNKVLDGIRPKIPDEIKESKDIAIQTLISVTKKCWSKKPKSRPSAASVRDELKELMDQMMMNTTATTKRGERGVTT